MHLVKEESFGIIPLSEEKDGWRIFLILHAKGNHWSFPKGHAHEGELPEQAAIRELKEETNLEVVRMIQKTPLIEAYQFRKKHETVLKTVYYFPAIVSGTVHLQGEEIRDGKWLPLQEAEQHLSFKEARSLCKQVMNLLT